MRKLKFLAILFSLTIVVSACGESDELPPTVTISQPINGTSYSVSDTIIFRAIVQDETKLKSINLSSDLGFNEDITTFDSEMTHQVGYNLLLDSSTPTGTYTLTLQARDDSDNLGSSSVNVTIQ